MADPSAGSGQALQGEAKRRYVADLFSRIAPRYDLMNTVMTGGLHHRWRKIAVGVATAGLDDHQVGFLQHAQMLDDADARDFGKGGTHRPGGPPSLAQQIENLAPSRVGQGGKYGIKARVHGATLAPLSANRQPKG